MSAYMKGKTVRPGNASDVQLVLRQAVAYLSARYRCSAEEANRRIEQEARAKKAGLDKVANAIVAGEMVGYHYDAPI
jgi:hypothetical protein